MTAAAARARAAGEREVAMLTPPSPRIVPTEPDDARHVAVPQIDDRALRPELERQAVHFDDARVAAGVERGLGADTAKPPAESVTRIDRT